MSKTTARSIRVACWGSVVIILSLAGFGPSETPAPDDTAVIAVIGGHAIQYSTIRVTAAAARERFIIENGHEPVSEAEVDEVEQMRRTSELRQLAARIRWIIHGQEASRLGVDVTQAEIKARWEELRQERDSERVRDEARAKVRALLVGLNAVYEDREDPDQVYQADLIEIVSREEWRAVLRQYRTRAARRTLEAYLAQESVEPAEVEDAVRLVLMQEKTDKAIDQQLIRSDPEFAEYIRLAGEEPSHEKVQSKGPNYLAAKRWQWWQERYREADIVIKDARFDGVRKLLFAETP